MKKLSAILIFVFFALNIYAQDCNCKLNFNSVIRQVKENYAGYGDKVNSENVRNFRHFTRMLSRRAVKAGNVDSCYVIMRTWTNFFRDQHLRVQLDWRYRQQFPEKIKEINKNFPKKALTPGSTERLTWKTALTQLDEESVLIRLPSFEWTEKNNIDSLAALLKNKYKRMPNWIIDIRGNVGGTDYAFSSLLPFIYTNPISIKPDEYWSSEGNIQVLKENMADSSITDAGRQFLVNIVALMENHIGQFINPSGKDEFMTSMDSVYSFPKKVGILIDGNSSSSAESFLLMAKQSKKITVFGENSAGSLDYANTQFFNLPCKTYNLIIAMSRSKRLPAHPIDNLGITPDVLIQNTIPDKVDVVLQKLKGIK